MLRRIVPGMLGVAFLVSVSGCGTFKSSTSEASVESPSESSSSSSGSGKDKTAYEQDIRDYTSAFATQGGDMDSFRRDITVLAEHHGVTDWEADPPTLEAIGSGVRSAGLKQPHIEAFLASLASDNGTQRQWIQQGYDSPLSPAGTRSEVVH